MAWNKLQTVQASASNAGSVSVNITPNASGNILAIDYGGKGGNNSLTSVTVGGVAADKVTDGQSNVEAPRAECWRFYTTGTSQVTVTATMGGSPSELRLIVTEYSGAASSSPVDATASRFYSYSGTPSISMTTATDNALLHAVICHKGTTITWGASQTELYQYSGQVGSSYKDAGTAGSGKTMSGTVSANYTCMIGWAIKPGAGAYTLAASAGSFAETGSAATLSVGRKVTADVGSYSETGTAATLRASRKVVAEAGSFAETGLAVSLLATRLLSGASAGAFVVVGPEALLVYTPVGTYTLSAYAGTFAFGGSDATLLRSLQIQGGPGSFLVTGSDITLLRGLMLHTAPEAFLLSGLNTDLLVGRALSAEAGAAVVGGTPTALLWGRVLAASLGTFEALGHDALLAYVHSYVLAATKGTFGTTGTAASLIYSGAPSPLRPFTLPVLLQQSHDQQLALQHLYDVVAQLLPILREVNGSFWTETFAPPSGDGNEGTIRFADGISWNPGSGRGLYQKVSGAWVKL